MNDKVYIHWNLPREIHREASKDEDFNKKVFKSSAHLFGLKYGFEQIGIKPYFNFKMHYFFNYRWLHSSKYYKYFFYLYNFIFGFIDNYLLYSRILNELKRNKIRFYYTELNPTITRRFLRKLRGNNIISIEWFGIFPNQLNYNVRPNKTLDQFDLIVSGEDYTNFFVKKPKKFLKIPQAIPLKKIGSVKHNKNKNIDILFIGSVANIHSNRWKYLEYLFLNYKSIELYGYGIEDVPAKFHFKKIFQRGLWGDKYYKKIKESKIVINLFQNDYENLNDGINIRAFEIPACKSLQICKRLSFLKNYFKENHDIVMFEKTDELKSKIDYYLDNHIERDEIISNSYNTIQKYDFSNQLRKIVKAAI